MTTLQLAIAPKPRNTLVISMLKVRLWTPRYRGGNVCRIVAIYFFSQGPETDSPRGQNVSPAKRAPLCWPVGCYVHLRSTIIHNEFPPGWFKQRVLQMCSLEFEWSHFGIALYSVIFWLFERVECASTIITAQKINAFISAADCALRHVTFNDDF